MNQLELDTRLSPDLATELFSGPASHDSPATLNGALARFYTYLKAAGRSAATVTSYRRRLARFMDYGEISPGMMLVEITPELLDRYAAAVRQTVTDYGGEERPLSAASRLAYIQSVKTFFGFCHRRGYLDRDVAVDLERPHLNHSARNKVMARENLYKLLDEAAASPRDLALIMFSADTGARRGELASLQTANLNLETLDAFVTGKTGEREVDFTEQTADALRSWLAVRPAVDHDYVFTGDMRGSSRNQGGPLTSDGLGQIFKRLGRRAGITGKCSPQAIRHLVGQTLTDNVNLALVQQKLGHTSITTTAMFYAHQDRSRVKAATVLHSPLNGFRKAGSNDY